MVNRKNLFLNFIIFLISSMTVVNVQANKRVSMYTYPAFNVKDNIMIVEDEPPNLIVCNTTDLTDFQTANDCYGVFVDLIGTEMIYPYCFGDHLYLPTINTSTYTNIILEILDRTSAHTPEYEGYCILNDTKVLHTGSVHFDERQKLFVQDNFAFLEVTEESNDNAIVIINATDKAHPNKVAHYKHSNVDIFDYAIHENIMIISIDDTENIRLVNITEKSNPIDIDISYSVPYTYRCSLEVKDNLLFTYEDTTIYVFEITNENTLELIYNIEIESIEDENTKRVIFYNNYLIAIQFTKISIFNLENPSNTTISEITYDGPGSISYYFGLVDNNRLYVSMHNTIEEYTLAIYDLTNILNPELLFPASYSTPFPVTTVTIITSILSAMLIILYRKKRKLKAFY